MFLRTLGWLLRRGKGGAESPLFNARTLPDPYPTYHRFRSEHPVFWEEGAQRWVLTRYADVVSVLRSPAASSERVQALDKFAPPAFRQLLSFRTHSMINCDPPRHNRLRLLVNKAFTARAVDAMAGDIQRLVDGFLDAVQPHGRMDLIADLAYPLPVTVIAQMLGVPPQDRDRFKHWSDALAVVAGGAGTPRGLKWADYRRVAQSYSELTAYLAGVVADRRARPRGDLISALVRAEEAGDRLTEDELYANVTLILVAGHETTTNLIGNGVWALLRHPDQWARLRENPTLVPTAVEELLRYDGPVQFTVRVLKDDLTVGGQAMGRGQMVLTLLAAADRDPEQFADPDRLDVGRPDNKHVAFGLGSHFCLGAQLARLEGRIALETLLRRAPNLRLDGPPPEYRPHFNLRGLKALPVAF
jgi:cytochrome P450